MAKQIRIFDTNAPSKSDPNHTCDNILEAFSWILKQSPDKAFDITLPEGISMFSGITAESVKEELSK